MFDIGWQELVVIAAISIIVVGPKDLPRVLAQMTRYLRKARAIAREFQSSIDEVVREAELEDIRKQVQATADLDLGKEIENTIDPSGQIARQIDLTDVQTDLAETARAVSAEEMPAASPDVPATETAKSDGSSDAAGADTAKPSAG